MPKIHFINKDAAVALTKPTRLIGLRGSYDQPLSYHARHIQLLQLKFDPMNMSRVKPDGQITDEDILAIIDFALVASESREEIIVHCGEGRIRSPAVAQFIEYILEFIYEEEGAAADVEPYYMATDHPGCLGSAAGMDRELFFRMKMFWEHQGKKDPIVELFHKNRKEGHKVVEILRATGMVRYIPKHLLDNRYPGYVFCPEDRTNTEELTFEERYALMYPGCKPPTNEFELGDARCDVENNRTPTHRIIPTMDKEAV